MLRRAWAVWAALLILTAATSAEVGHMAAEGDAAALMSISEIDGAPVDMPDLLAEHPEARMRIVATLEPLDKIDSEAAADQARAILADPKYRQYEPSWFEHLSGPLYRWSQRMIGFITDLVRQVGDALLRWISSQEARWIGIPTLVVATALGTWVLGRRRAREVERRAVIDRILQLGREPAELEKMAEAAEDQGDHAESIRLRFVAGLLRLDTVGMIIFSPGLPNGMISGELKSAVFDRLAAQFDAVVYGKRLTSSADADAARRDWLELIGASR